MLLAPGKLDMLTISTVVTLEKYREYTITATDAHIVAATTGETHCLAVNVMTAQILSTNALDEKG